jgi:2-phospho-L-lactate guanylyltransferase
MTPLPSGPAGPPLPDRRFGVLVPVKPPVHAKSRLAPLGDTARRRLAVGFAVDTVAAALASRIVEVVMVVTDDHLLAAELAALGAQVLPDGAAEDLNASLVQAAAELVRRRPDLAPAALCADLPALDADELTAALARAARFPAATVADAEGVGTTLTTAQDLGSFRPRFGPGSHARHVAGGAVQVDAAGPTLRRDVDTPADLVAAARLGLGRHTAAAVDELGLLAEPRV